MFLGAKTHYLTIGGAASDPSLRTFLSRCFKCEIFYGYGTTEAGSIANNNVSIPKKGV